MPAYTEVKALADVYAIEVIPVIDTTGFINAFIRDGAIFLNMDTGNMDMTPAQIAAHEISHHRKDTPEGKATRRKIDVRSRAFIQYRRELSRLNFGEKEFRDGALISRLDIIEEFAADLEAGIKQHYGVTLSEGLFPDSQITTIQERIEKGKAAAGKDVTRGPPEEDKGEYSIREQQDPPVSDDPKVLNRYLKDETDAIVQAIMHKLRPEHMTYLELFLKSPEWFDNPQFSKIYRLFARDRNERYHETFNVLNMADDIDAPENTVAEAGKALKRKGLSWFDRLAGKESAEYKMLSDFIDYFDTEAKRNPNKSDDENLADCEAYMRKNGATDDVVRVWRLYRQSYDKALELQTRQLREMIAQIIEEAAFRGESPDASLAELKETLKYALAEMETWKGYYAPRIREAGNWKVQGYKKHGPLEVNREYYRDHRGSELSARRLANKLRREGWTVYSVSQVEKLPEAVYQDVKAAAAAKLIDAALEKVKENSTSIVAIRSEVLRAVADEIRARGFRSHMIHRKEGAVIKGYIKDPIKRHLLYANQLAGGLSKAYVARRAIEELLDQKVNGKHVGGIDPIADPKAYEVATNYIEEQLRNLDASDRVAIPS